jgi:hypothetical protein
MPWKYAPGLVRKCSAGFAQTMGIPGWQPRLRVDLLYPRLDPGQFGVVVGYHRFQLRKLGVDADALSAQLGYLFLGHATYGRHARGLMPLYLWWLLPHNTANVLPLRQRLPAETVAGIRSDEYTHLGKLTAAADQARST